MVIALKSPPDTNSNISSLRSDSNGNLEYPNIQGSWKLQGGTTLANIYDQKGPNFSVNLEDGRFNGPGSFLSKSKIRVNFPDAPGCCTGELDGNEIQWNNATSWFKK